MTVVVVEMVEMVVDVAVPLMIEILSWLEAPVDGRMRIMAKTRIIMMHNRSREEYLLNGNI